jgi:lipopolysaccharide transport system ATP-binding protein
MGTSAVSVSDLGKRYVLGEALSHYPTLKDTLTTAALRAGSALRSPLKSMRRKQPTHFWALRGVSLEIAEGEVVGIIGRNGAGKSTLLKILSRITEPTEGYARIHGRVGSLLEVGTGFHPELSGRENTFLNGAILGMQRREIAAKFDEIVAFAEVERFIDTPVKRYSSGMYLRLAFAVAAHLETEILIVDEVLAVGDASFQKKCLGKMGEVAHQGRTVLFVSHNMDAVQRLCTRAVLLEQGAVQCDADTAQVVARYLSARTEASVPGRWASLEDADRTGTGEARFTAVRYWGGSDSVGNYPNPWSPFTVELDISASGPLALDSLAVVIWSAGGVKLVNADTISAGQRIHLATGGNRVVVTIDELYLTPGSYRLGLWMASAVGSEFDYIESALGFDVMPSGTDGLGMRPVKDGLVPCRFRVDAGTPRAHAP